MNQAIDVFIGKFGGRWLNVLLSFCSPGIIRCHCFGSPFTFAQDFFHVLGRDDEGRGSAVAGDGDRLTLRCVDQFSKLILCFDWTSF